MTSSENCFAVLSSVDSTNNYAMGLAHEGLAKHGDAFFALEQTAGKGRRGKEWHADNGLNIILSIVVEPLQLKTTQQFHLSVAVSLGCYDFFSNLVGDETKVKWPNDIYWRDRKAGGVLIETIQRGDKWNYAIIGIGINVNQTNFDDSLKKAVSIKQITGKDNEVITLAKNLRSTILKRIEELQGNGFKNLLGEYNQYLFKLGEMVKLRKDKVVFETTIIGVNAAGKLITKDAFERELNFDSVEWVL